MNPHRLKISGFLSYHDPTELDFSQFDLACISGANGAGKSSILDAITWALFGQARRRDDSIINSRSDAAEVTLDFWYENNLYRVQRRKPKGKTTLLEFFIMDEQERWRPLTEHTVGETDKRIQQTLRMDYETFTNASFFLQGKADQFAQQKPGDRKRILSSILGLEVWEEYRERAASRRKTLEDDRREVEGRVTEIKEELNEEAERKARLTGLEEALKQAEQQTRSQEALVEALRKRAASLEERRGQMEKLDNQRRDKLQQLAGFEQQLAARSAELEKDRQRISAAGTVEAAYQTWQKARAELEKLDALEREYSKIEKTRTAPLMEIERFQSKLQSERENLTAAQAQISAYEAQLPALNGQLTRGQTEIANLQARAALRETLAEEQLRVNKVNADALAENKALKKEMDDLDDQIKQLDRVQGAECPLCGQPLDAEDREALIQRLRRQGRELGDRHRANRALIEEGAVRLAQIDSELRELRRVDETLRLRQRELDQLSDRLKQVNDAVTVWQTGSAERLKALASELDAGAYAPQARAALAEIDARLQKLGYDATKHVHMRRQEQEGRASQEALRELETARARLEPLEREIATLREQRDRTQNEAAEIQQNFEREQKRLEEDTAGMPDLRAAERTYREFKEKENRLRGEVGGARQRVEVLENQRTRLKDLNARREDLSHQIANHRALEKAFGKDGVPALLIDMALPEIQNRANDLLDRLSAGAMSVSFETQRDYKDKNRDDKRETLDILISDAAGRREYELFSGGEAFRVNFAIRLALSRVLAQRAGARLQTLVIDEGFGSQDVDGRQRLIEAINLVRSDFSKILVITHLEELKDAFPARIEVEKLDSGSALKVVA